MREMIKRQRVLIIGGSSGIGLATAKSAIAADALVTIGSYDEKSLRTAADEIRSLGLSTVVVDTFENASIEELFRGDPYHHIVVTAAWSRLARSTASASKTAIKPWIPSSGGRTRWRVLRSSHQVDRLP